jgi:hypothetical protein
VASGRLLAAGPWATTSPAVLNPSYLVAGAAVTLARLTGDPGWNSVATATRELDSAILDGRTLPSDWITLPIGGSVAAAEPSGAPDGSAPAQYGLDAPRLLIRLAASCDSGDRALASSEAGAIGGAGQPALRSLTGQPLVSWQHPIGDVAVAAVQTAHGNHPAATRALADAQALQAKTPTYYGAAWAALGTTMLTTDLLRDCA